MAVKAVQNDNSRNKMNYLNSIVIGAICGHSFKWALPITPQEKDEEYIAKAAQIINNINQARANEIEAIRAEISKAPGADEFIRMCDDKKSLYTEIKKLTGPLHDNLMNLLARVDNVGINVGNAGRDELVAYTKKIRPAGIFMATGAFIGLGIALINNVCAEISNNAKDSG